MKRKVKRDGMSDEDFAEFGELASLDYRLGDLLVMCESLTISMSDSFDYRVLGSLRCRPGAGLVKLSAAHGDLRQAIGQAWMAANELERQSLVRVSVPEVGG